MGLLTLTPLKSAFVSTQSIEFNNGSTNQWISIGNNYSKDRTNTFSWSVWFKLNSTGDHYPLGKENTTDTNGVLLLVRTVAASTVIQLKNTNSLLIDRRAAFSWLTATWYHLVVTYSGSGAASGVKIYKNGSEMSETTTSDTLSTNSFANTNNFGFGRAGDNTSNIMKGRLNNCSLWNIALSSSQISSIYNNGKPNDLSQLSFFSNCEHWYRMGNGDSIAANGIIDHGSGTVTLVNGTPNNSPTIQTDAP